MGCGQSKIGIIYPRKNKNKGGRKRSGSDGDSDEEDAEADCGPAGAAEEGQRGAADGASASEAVGASGDAPDGDGGDAGAARKPPVPATPGPLLAQSEMSSSQMDFFRMLDEKIESGPDYDSGSEEEKAAERARLRALLRDWETASQASSARSAASAPVTPLHPGATHPFGGATHPAAPFFNVNGDLPLHRSLVAAPHAVLLPRVPAAADAPALVPAPAAALRALPAAPLPQPLRAPPLGDGGGGGQVLLHPGGRGSHAPRGHPDGAAPLHAGAMVPAASAAQLGGAVPEVQRGVHRAGVTEAVGSLSLRGAMTFKCSDECREIGLDTRSLAGQVALPFGVILPGELAFNTSTDPQSQIPSRLPQLWKHECPLSGKS